MKITQYTSFPNIIIIPLLLVCLIACCQEDFNFSFSIKSVEVIHFNEIKIILSHPISQEDVFDFNHYSITSSDQSNCKVNQIFWEDLQPNIIILKTDYLNEQTIYTLHLTDIKWESSNSQFISSVSYDFTTPLFAYYSIGFNQSYANANNQDQVSLQIKNETLYSNFHFCVVSDGMENGVNNTLCVDQIFDSENIQLDVSPLFDGMLIIEDFYFYSSNDDKQPGIEGLNDLIKDTLPPDDYSISFHQETINKANQVNVQLDVQNTLISESYRFNITSNGSTGGTLSLLPFSGELQSNSITLDLSEIYDGELFIENFQITDLAGNSGPLETGENQAIKDTIAPTGYAINFNTLSINSLNEDSITVQVSGHNSEDYSFSISSDGNQGGEASTKTYTGTVPPSGLITLDVSFIYDGNLEINAFVLVDEAGNTGEPVDGGNLAVKNTIPPAIIDIQPEKDSYGNPVNTNITITFDSTLDSGVMGTITFGTPALNFIDGTNCSIQIIGNQVIVNPDVDFNAFETLSDIEITGFSSNQNIMNAYMDADYQFTTYLGELSITNTTQSSEYVSLTNLDSRIVLCWTDYRDLDYEIYCALLSDTGEEMVEDFRLTNSSGASQYPAITAMNNEAGISWQDDRNGSMDVYFSILDNTGAKLTADLQLTTEATDESQPDLISSGTCYGLSWTDNRLGSDEIFYMRVNENGNPITSNRQITAAALNSNQSSIQFNGNDYCIIWYDNRLSNDDLYFNRVHPGLDVPILEIQTTTSSYEETDPDLLWNGYELGCAFNDTRDGNLEIYFLQMDELGNKKDTETRITLDSSISTNPSLAWNGNYYGLVWSDYRQGNYEIYYAKIDSSGNKIGNDVRITNSTGESGNPEISFFDNHFVLCYDDDTSGDTEILCLFIDENGNIL